MFLNGMGVTIVDSLIFSVRAATYESAWKASSVLLDHGSFSDLGSM